jgi:hypothetical protein
VTVDLERGAANEGGFGFELQVQHVQHTHGLFDDFGADAVTGEDCDLHRGSFSQVGFGRARV